MIHIGTAAWNIPGTHKTLFDETGSHLERYSHGLNGVEINSSFYREHQLKTYVRWAASTPDSFRFTVKLSRQFTHDQNLDIDSDEFQNSLQNVFGLGSKLGAILVQLPGKQLFQPKIAERFFREFRRHYEGPIVLEPRNQSWAEPKAIALYRNFKISKVISDPERCFFEKKGALAENLNQSEIAYFRLHGSPKIYASSYSTEFLQELADRIRQLNFKLHHVYCIFDNTQYGASIDNAFTLKRLVADSNDRSVVKRSRPESSTLSQL